MGPIAYSLCGKPIIGMVMYLAWLCGFPPVIKETPLPLAQAGSSISIPFTVAVDKKYTFVLNFKLGVATGRFPVDIIGNRFDNIYCLEDVRYQDIPIERRFGLGRPILFRVLIRRAADRTMVVDRSFSSLCINSSNRTEFDRKIGSVELTRGQFIAEITNVESQTGLDDVRTYVYLH